MSTVKESTVKVERITNRNVEMLAVVVGALNGETGRVDISDAHMSKILDKYKQYRLTFGEYEDGDAFIELSDGHPEELTEKEKAEAARKEVALLQQLMGKPLSPEDMEKILGGGQ